MQFSRFTTAVVALALITLAIAAGGAAIGAAEETESEWDELVNSSIETTENTSYVELDIEFAETFENTSEETVELTLYNESEYDSDGDAATPVLEDTVTGTPNETVNNEYNLSDTDLEIDSEYRAIVEVENENNIESGFVAADDEAVGGATFGSADSVPGFGAGVAVAAVALATALLARARVGGS